MTRFISAFFLFLSIYFSNQKHFLSNGSYRAVIEEHYGYNNYEFDIRDDEFILNTGEKILNCKIIWVTDFQFKVKGFTEPFNVQNTNEIVDRPFFVIIKAENNTFNFEFRNTHDVIYSGQFIKK
ncbi:hypothetical protein HYN48_13975 [Flavobacterium magnum]|uniref:DNA topoisomerase IV n=1 Tax=Flavobacterium magnum TaxID=2162713 RepID=A0A2S0RGP2_9FLAO|nr:hypothetical protein [Flavobacterium magnum]AWA31107.1 hypothetical protein HYN48_13975 [Flavobacterium magnum]